MKGPLLSLCKVFFAGRWQHDIKCYLLKMFNMSDFEDLLRPHTPTDLYIWLP